MGHDTIPKTSFKNFNRVKTFIGPLREQSLERIKKSALFSSVETKKKWQEDNEIEFLDLNLETRINQKNKIEGFLLSNENALRESLDLPTYNTYKEFMEREDDPDFLDIDEEILGEAANILLDLIEIKEKPILAFNEKTS